MFRYVSIGVLVLGFLASTGTARASLIGFEFEAIIQSVDPSLQPITTAHTLTGRAIYKDSVPVNDVFGDGSFGIYSDALISLKLAIEPLGLMWTNDGPGDVTVVDDRFIFASVVDRFGLATVAVDGSPVGAGGTIFPVSFALSLVDQDKTVFDSLTIPQILDLADFEGRVAVLEFAGLLPNGESVEGIVDARLTNLRFFEVPEPAGIWIFVTALAALGFATRPRTSDRPTSRA